MKKRNIAILLLMNCVVVFLGFGISSSKASFIVPESNFNTCKTELLWNYTMGDSGRGLALTPDGKFLAVGSWDGNLYYFDTSNPIPLWNKTIPGIVDQVAISADGNYIIASSDNYMFYLFHKSSSTPIWNFTAGDNIRTVAMTPDGEYFVIGSWDGYVYLFDRSSPTPIWNYTLGNRVYAVDISSDGEIIVAGGVNIGVNVFNRTLSIPLIWTNNSMSTVYGIDLSANDLYLVAGTLTGVTGTIFLYDILNPNPTQQFETSEIFGHVSITNDGEYFVGAVSFEFRFYLFEKGTSDPVWNYTADDQIGQVEISGNGNYIVAGSYDHNFYLFNRSNIYASLQKKEMLILKTFESGGMVWSVEISETGEFLAFISNDDNVYMFHNDIGEEVNNTPSISFGNTFLIVMLGAIMIIIVRIKMKHGISKNKS